MTQWIHCEDCDRSFKNPVCYANHKKVPKRSHVTIKAKTKTTPRTICQRIRRCTQCGTTVKDQHKCGQRYCRNCQTHQPYDHLCYMQVIKGGGEGGGGDFDIDEEARDILGAEEEESVYEKRNVVMNGAKLMSIDVKEKARNKKKKDVTTLRIIDSCNFIPAPLSSFPKTFGLTEMKKGYFPYLFNTRVNENYVGPWPSLETYNPEHMKPDQRKAFLSWYDEQKDKVFNMAREMHEKADRSNTL